MGDSPERYFIDVISGRRRGIGAGLLRAALRAAEPPYAALMSLRNAMFDAGVRRIHRLPVSVVSVGNITAGGTGKTPVVRWLASRLRGAGMRPAVLMRGYKRGNQSRSDEQLMLQSYLSATPAAPPVVVHADPDRVAGGGTVLRDHPDTGLFILDDGFQHRRLHRDFDLVLIDATNPFGFGHVHPRGLLREPLAGLRRADAFVLTRCDAATQQQLRELADLLRAHSPPAPVYRTTHTHTGLRSAESTPDRPPDLPLEFLDGKKFFAFAGIANPAALERQLKKLPGTLAGVFWFPDHHAYTVADLTDLRRRAREARADVLLVTEKDFVKLSPIASHDRTPPLLRVELEIRFEGQGEQGLLDLIQTRIDKAKTP